MAATLGAPCPRRHRAFPYICGNPATKLLETIAMHQGMSTQTFLSSASGARVPADFYYAWRFI
jgi:hypothetical protein